MYIIGMHNHCIFWDLDNFGYGFVGRWLIMLGGVS